MVPICVAAQSRPVFSPAGGTFNGSTTVTITCPSGSAFYTTDGSTPTIGSAIYQAPITISNTTTLQALCAVVGVAQYNIDDNTAEHMGTSPGWQPADTAGNGGNPGGSGVPTDYDQAYQNTGNATPSLDGASLLLTQSSSQTVNETNVLWPFLAGACDSCTYFFTDTNIYLNSNYAGASELEMDTFNFNHTALAKETFGLQYCWGHGCPGSHSSWDSWNESTTSGGAHGWLDTGATTPPTIGAWNHIQVQDHVVAGDTSCGGYPALHYDYMKLNGKTLFKNLSYCAGPVNPSWTSNVGQQYQINIYALSTTATINVDEAETIATGVPSGITSALYRQKSRGGH
jgi:hypothetical protein